jgi:DNA-binding NtrC family response regulator
VKGFSPNATVAMRKHAWPGNVRELENRIKKAIVLCRVDGDRPRRPRALRPRPAAILTLAEAKDKFQRDYINEVLAVNNGNRTKTARDLGVDPRTIFRHLEKEADAPGPGSSDDES